MLELFLILIPICLSDFSSSHTISLSTYAQWGSVPLVDQIFHFCNSYSNELAEKFLFAVTKNNGEVIQNDRLLFETVNQIIPKNLLPILNSSLVIGSNIPKTIFNGFYKENNSKSLNEKFQNHYQTDFVYCGNQQSEEIAYQNIVYTDIQQNSTLIHNLLSQKIPFVLRSTPTSSNNKSKLRGYGIELRPFKYSMEYGIKNSQDEENEILEINGEIQQDDNISSLSFNNFDAKFASYWAEQIEQSNSDYLSKLREITTNWPLYLKDISESQIDVELQREMHRFLEPKSSSTYLNGRLINLDLSDSFSIQKILEEERTIRDLMLNLNFTDNEIDRILSTSLKDNEIFFFDFNNPKISYYNDIETEKKYEDFNDDISQIGEYRFRMVKIRKNLLKTVLYFDPTTVEGINYFYFLIYFASNMYPITAGILPIFQMNNDLSRKVAFAYHHLLINNPKEAMSFLIHSVKYMEIDKSTNYIKKINEEGFARAYEEIKTKNKNKKRWCELGQLFNCQSEEYKSIQEVVNWYKKKNIKMNTASMNGYTFSFNEISPMYMMTKIYKMLNVITQMTKKIGEKAKTMDIFGIIKRSKMYPIASRIDDIFIDQIKSVNIHKMNFKKQIEFINNFEKIEYYRNDVNINYDSYAFLFTNSSEFGEIDKFIDKINKNLTKSKIKFAINPKFDDFELDSKEFPILLINGRILLNFNYTDPIALKLIDEWNYGFIVNQISKFHLDNTNQKFYLNTLYTSFLDDGVNRGSLNLSMIYSPQSPLKFSPQTFNPNLMNLTMIVNPFDRNFQRFSSLIEFFYQNEILNVEICLNPVYHESLHLPTLSSFYRSAVTDDELNFTMLSDKTTYSSIIDAPSSWQVESLKSAFDLDNIFINELPSGVKYAEYVLTGIVIEGSCITQNNLPAINAKLSLKDKTTMVMKSQNGYFQLIGSIGPNTITFDSLNTKLVEINSYVPQKVLFKLTVDQINYKKVSNKNTSRIDIFSVASGHLYERLIKIMMISAKRNANPASNVTFWILKNFLSAQFKAELPKISKKYNFNYNLVQYKWPNWLYPQHEKQRIIWANKILFLDVLFPADLDRVIYVDADQIVRTDLDDLMKMDFGNAPYAFPPFCDSRIETEPYRFWKTGYWKKHLKKIAQSVAYSKNKTLNEQEIQNVEAFKYHISALFAVDLPRFREMNAGDILRYNYQHLAPDGNSLSNLDQDLPNFLQDVLPIFSLPQDWLWCETWCSDESMKYAKNIDLCNNPLTKVPKLEIAKTRIEEWPGLDKEASDITADVDEYEKLFFQ